MNIEKSRIDGVFFIQLKPNEDDRGFFMRVYDENKFEEYGLNKLWVQENHSRSIKKGTIRGLHFQLPPYSETKLVRCVRGAVLDVFVDLRSGSNTFGKWDSLELSEENKKMVFIPRGFAHGFCTLTGQSEILYKVDNYYSPESEIGIAWNDENLHINWPVQSPVISKKDRSNITFKEFVNSYSGIQI